MVVETPEAVLSVQKSVSHPVRALLFGNGAAVGDGVEEVGEGFDEIRVGVLDDARADGAGLGVHEGGIGVASGEFLRGFE